MVWIFQAFKSRSSFWWQDLIVHKFNLNATVADEVLGDEAQDWDRGKRDLMIQKRW